MSKPRRILPWLNVLLLLALGVCILIWYPVCNVIAYCCIALGLLLAVYRIFYLLRRHDLRMAKLLSCIVSIFLCYGLVAAGITGALIWRAGLARPVPGCDYILVLGASVNGTVPSMSLQERIDCAYRYLKENPNTICIVSGGQGAGEELSEAACMFRELCAMGIAPERIWLEENAASTRENIHYSLELIEKKTGFYPSSLGIVSSEYHLFRACLVASDHGVDAVGIPAETALFGLRVNYFLREIVASWYYLLT